MINQISAEGLLNAMMAWYAERGRAGRTKAWSSFALEPIIHAATVVHDETWAQAEARVVEHIQDIWDSQSDN